MLFFFSKGRVFSLLGLFNIDDTNKKKILLTKQKMHCCTKNGSVSKEGWKGFLPKDWQKKVEKGVFETMKLIILDHILVHRDRNFSNYSNSSILLPIFLNCNSVKKIILVMYFFAVWNEVCKTINLHSVIWFFFVSLKLLWPSFLLCLKNLLKWKIAFSSHGKALLTSTEHHTSIQVFKKGVLALPKWNFLDVSLE